MKNWECKLGLHTTICVSKQQTKEVDSESGIHLKRNVLKCSRCGKLKYVRMDNLLSVVNTIYCWTWE
jgi:hypothetical protein